MTGTLYGVGVGPGDPELVTVKAARLISSATSLFYLAANGGQSLARSIAAPYIAPGTHEFAIDMPMREDATHGAAIYDQCAEHISQLLGSGKNAVMLCEGDPLFYGSFMYVLDRVGPKCRVEIVPGVSSLAASAAALGRPLTRRNDTLKVLPATLPDEELHRELLAFSSAVVIKVGRHLPRVKSLLQQMGLLPFAFAVERASQEDQRIFRLDSAMPEQVSYFTTIIIQNQTAS